MDGDLTVVRPQEDGDTELAQASAGEAVGRVDTIKGNVFVTHTDGTKVKAESGQDIFQGDVVETDASGAIGIVFADDSTFSLAEAGEMTIDEMIYDPGGQEGSAALSVTQGVFTFVSGQIAKTAVNAMVVNTPTATIGIRGTSGGGKSSPSKGDTFSLFQDADGNTGEMTIATQVGSATLNAPNQTTRITSKFALPSKPIIMPASAVNQFYGSAIAAAPPPPTASNQNQQGGENQGEGGEQGQAAGEGGEQTQEGETEQAAEGETGAQTEQQLEGEAQLEGGEQPVEGETPQEGEQLAEGPGPEGPGPEGPGPEGDNIEGAARTAAEQAVQQALAGGGNIGDAQAAGQEAALSAAIAEARSNGISEAEIQAGAGAFQDALAGGGSLDDAFDAAMSAGETAGLQAGIQFDQAIQQAQQQGAFGPAGGGIGPIGGSGGFGSDSGPQGGNEGGDQGDQGAQGGGNIFGGDIFGGDIFGGDIFGGDIFGGDILGGDIFGGDIFGDPFGDPFGDQFFDPFAPEAFEAFFDAADDFEDDDNIIPPSEDDVIFGEEFINTAVDDTFIGNTLNTEYRYDQSLDGEFTSVSTASGGVFGLVSGDVDIITDAGGDRDRLTFESLDEVGIKMSVSTAGFVTFDIYSEFLNTSSLSTVLTSIDVSTDVEDIQGSVTTLDDLESGIIIQNAMDLTGSETAYMLAGGTSADTMTISDTNTVGSLMFGKSGDDTITGNSTSDQIIYGGAGADVIDAKGSSNGDSVFGGAGNDTIKVTVATGDSSYDGGDDTDTLDYSGLGSAATFVVGADSIAVSQGSGSNVSAENFEYVTGSDNGDTFTLTGDTSTNALETITAGTGNDTFNIGASATVDAVLIGGTGNDVFIVGENASISTTLDGGDGTDVIGIDDTTATIDAVNFEAAQLRGTSSDDTLLLNNTTAANIGGGLSITSVDGRGGDDTLNMTVNVSSVTVANVETITGTAGGDSIVLADGGQTIQATGVETITGGSGADTVTLGANGTYVISGGGDTDALNLGAAGSFTLTASTLESITSFTGTNDEAVTFQTAVSGITVDLSDGTDDHLTLANGSNSVSVSNTETITGGTGVDTITISGSTGATIFGGGSDDVITGGSGADRYVFEASSNGIDTIASSGFATGASGDILDYKTNSLGVSGLETVYTDTLANISALGTNGLMVLTDDAIGDATALETALDGTVFDTNNFSTRAVVWEIDANTVGVGIATNSDTVDDNNVSVTQLAEITGFADQSAVDTFTAALDANNVDIL